MIICIGILGAVTFFDQSAAMNDDKTAQLKSVRNQIEQLTSAEASAYSRGVVSKTAEHVQPRIDRLKRQEAALLKSGAVAGNAAIDKLSSALPFVPYSVVATILGAFCSWVIDHFVMLLVMIGLGIPRDLWDVPEDQSPVIDPHWVGICETLTERAAAGLPLPHGVSPDRTSVIYRLAMKRRCGVLELEADVVEGVTISNERPEAEHVRSEPTPTSTSAPTGTGSPASTGGGTSAPTGTGSPASTGGTCPGCGGGGPVPRDPSCSDCGSGSRRTFAGGYRERDIPF